MFIAACQFDGEFSWNPKTDAGPWNPNRDAGQGDPDTGAPVSGQGGSGGSAQAGQGGSESEAGQGGSESEAGSGGMCGAGAGAQGGVGGSGSDPGACDPACEDGELCCDGVCVAANSNEHCGACNKDCSALSEDGVTCSCVADGHGWLDCRGPLLNVCDGDDEPIAGNGGDDDPPVAGQGGDDDPPVDEEPPVAGGGSEAGSGGVGGEPEAGSGGEPEAGSGGTGGVGGEPEAGSGGDEAPVPLHDLEVTAFTLTNQDGALFLVIGDTAKGSVTYHNPNDVPFPVSQIVIAGRPPGGSNAGGPYLDLIPTLGGPTTIAANGDLTYSATRTMVDTDPLGTWRFYPTWNDSVQWHDGASKNVEVLSELPVSGCEPACADGQECCGDDSCVDVQSDINNCGACGNVCPFENSLCCNGTCTDALSNTTCGACERDCSLLGDGSVTCTCTQEMNGNIKCDGPVLGLCL